MHVTYIDVPERVSPQIAPRLGGTRARDGRASTESDRFTRRRGETNRNETNETNIIIDTLAELSHFFLLFFFPLFLFSFHFSRNTHESHVLGVSIRGCCRCRFEPISANHRCRLHSGEGGGETGGRQGEGSLSISIRTWHVKGVFITRAVSSSWRSSSLSS